MIVNGKQIAQEIIESLKKQTRPKKFLAAVLVGEDEISKSFLRQKEKVAEELNLDFRIYKFPHPPAERIKQDDLRKEIFKISQHKTCGGVIVQLPLPAQINKHYVLNVIPREKDVDVLGERALGAFYTGRNPVLPPAVEVVDSILKTYNLKLKTLKVAVIGLGFLVGKPIAHWLMGKCQEVYLLDRDSDLKILKEAEMVISGVGKAGLIKPEMLKEDALVIDFGYSINQEGKISGDFDASSLTAKNHQLKAISYTPTPGGTGPVLVAKLFENFYKLIQY